MEGAGEGRRVFTSSGKATQLFTNTDFYEYSLI